MTPRDLLRSASESFRRTGIPDPEYDSAMLLSALTGQPPLLLRLDLDTVLDEKTIRSFGDLCARRLQREPLQYILKEAFFCGLLFHVDSRVLIPRPETELLCEWAADLLSGMDCPQILDLCCGSGCLGISLKLRFPASSVTLSDLSAHALDVAQLNAARLHAETDLLQSDLFDRLGRRSFDLIISNPPYIPSLSCSSLQPEVMKEPLMALDGGSDGLAFYRRICADAPSRLHSGGWLLMELGDGESDPVRSMMLEAGFASVEIRNDYQSLPRMIGGKLP